MGRKGVSKRKKSKEKTAPVAVGIPATNGRKVEPQPEQVTEKAKPSTKGSKKR